MNDIALCSYITDRQSYKWYGVHFGVRFLTQLPPWYAHKVTYAILIIRLLSHFLFAVFPILSVMIYYYPLNPQMVVGAVSSLYRRFAMCTEPRHSCCLFFQRLEKDEEFLRPRSWIGKFWLTSSRISWGRWLQQGTALHGIVRITSSFFMANWAINLNKTRRVVIFCG